MSLDLTIMVAQDMIRLPRERQLLLSSFFIAVIDSHQASSSGRSFVIPDTRPARRAVESLREAVDRILDPQMVRLRLAAGLPVASVVARQLGNAFLLVAAAWP